MFLKFGQVVDIVSEFALKACLAHQVYKVFLFGSYATGKATEGSDIDVCFVLYSYNDNNKYKTVGDLYRMAVNNWNLDIQPVAYLVSDLDNRNSFLNDILPSCIEIWPNTSAQDTSQGPEAAGCRADPRQAAS